MLILHTNSGLFFFFLVVMPLESAFTFASVGRSLYCMLLLSLLSFQCSYLNQNCTMPHTRLENVHLFTAKWLNHRNVGENVSTFLFLTIIYDGTVDASLFTGFTLHWLLVVGHPVVALTVLYFCALLCYRHISLWMLNPIRYPHTVLSKKWQHIDANIVGLFCILSNALIKLIEKPSNESHLISFVENLNFNSCGLEGEVYIFWKSVLYQCSRWINWCVVSHCSNSSCPHWLLKVPCVILV